MRAAGLALGVRDREAAGGVPSPALGERLRAEARRLGTPLYAYDGRQLEADARAVARAFPDPWVRLYSVKANPVPGVVARVAALGFGASAVSRGEGSLALRAGLPPSSVALEGVGKSPADLRWTVDLAASGRPLLWVSVESPEEAADLARLARRWLRTDQVLDALVRINPDVEPDTHEGLAVGRRESKFGLSPEEASSVLATLGPQGPVRWRGVHVHAGSQLRSVEAWSEAVRAALEVFARHAGALPHWDTLDLGGGFPVDPWEEVPGPDAFAQAAAAVLREVPEERRPARLAVEPGRAVVARAGWLVARVLHVRRREPAGGRQVVLDAGMTELVRPALYGARHPIVALTSHGRPADPGLPVAECVVEGPVCESTDRLGVALLPPLRRGDLVAVGHAGAYASAMSSTYNGRPRPPEVLLEPDGSRTVLRRRATLRSLA
jgi:diaminopimelate decarboxylase